MKKRLLKKKTMQIIKHMSNYTDAKLSIVKSEYYKEVEDLVKKGSHSDLDLHFDKETINIMKKHKCGWFYHEVVLADE